MNPVACESNFQLFTKGGIVRSDPFATISKGGNIFLNAACIKEFFGEKKFVELLYNNIGMHQCFGMRPLVRPGAYSYKLNFSNKGNGATFSGTAFLKFLGLQPEFKRCKVQWDAEQQLAVVFFNEEKP